MADQKKVPQDMDFQARRIIRRLELQELVGLSKSSIYARLDKNGRYFDAEFPRPIRFGGRAVGWRLEEVEEWLANRDSAGAE